MTLPPPPSGGRSRPNESPIRRIAMWSGPRNISTAMMRAWENRPDTMVVDEPFYAVYLERTGKQHRGAAEVLEHGETDWKRVVRALTGGSAKVPIFYQKQMTHHLLPEIDRGWLGGVTNCFLIRDPREVIISYVKKSPEPTLEDLGFVQQAEIFEFTQRLTGATPPVVDARDVLENPEKTLRLLCHALEIEFDSAMLKWPAGPRDSDGIWAKYWYDAVTQTTSFQAPHEVTGELPQRLLGVYEVCRDCYEQLYQFRLR